LSLHNIKTLIFASLLLLSLGVFAQGQLQPDATPAVKITVQPEQLQLVAGKSATLNVRLVVPSGHHAYLDAGTDGGYLPIAISLSAIEKAGIKVQRVSAPRGEKDEQYHAAVLRGEGVFKYALTAPSGAKAGSEDYTITVGSQICSDTSGSCFFPRSDTLHVKINITRSPAGHVDHNKTATKVPVPAHHPTASPPAAGNTPQDPSATAHAKPVENSSAAQETAAPAVKSPASAVAASKEQGDSSSKQPAQQNGAGSALRATPKPMAPSQAPGNTARASDAAINFAQYTPRTKLPSHSLLIWLLLAFVAGLLMNIMPCVLPVISIKVLSLVQQAGESRRRALGMGVAFAAGMMVVFLALAVTAILFGLGWGEQFQSQAFLVAMIAVVFAFALSLFGVYEFSVPHPVGALAVHAHHREGYGSAFLKGMLATLLATPCSGPFLGSTLAWTLTQPPVTVLLIFGMLGLGMALPYVILSAHPAFLKHLPKPGPWMETFKHSMGFLLLATVVYLMVSLNQQHLLFTIMFLFCVAVGGWIWGRFSMRSVTAFGRSVVLTIAIVVVIAGAYLSFRTLPGMLPAPGTEKSAALTWEEFDPGRLQQYHNEGRSVFLDFTADWCANCKFNEMRVYSSAAIRQQLRQKNVVVMKADLTREGPSAEIIRRLMKQLGARSIPFLAVFPGNQPRAPYTLHDLVDAHAVSNILHALPDTVGGSKPVVISGR